MALADDTIFIQGILARSGTNFLHELLTAHPDCGSTGALQENFFLMFADQLARYVESVSGRWKPEWELPPSAGAELLASLGDGLLAFLDRRRAADPRGPRPRLVARTPHAANLPLFFKLFPRARLVVLVRDGRDLVESFVRSFDVPYRPVMERWAEAARTIVEFDRAHRGGPLPYTIVRYEDLVTELEPQLRRLLDFLGLDAARYDFAAAADTPVIGSSTFRGGAPGVHWQPLAKTAEFKPLERSREWPAELTAELESIAGDQLRYFGYSAR